jgi:hypothetical protein
MFLRKIIGISLFIVSTGSLFGFTEKNDSKNKDVLLTYRRSGTNWTVGVLQAICKRPFRYLDEPDVKEHIGLNRLGVEIDETLPFFYRTHEVSEALKKIKGSKSRLVCTLRNYKECIVKEGQFNAEEFLDAIRQEKPVVKDYFDNLYFFDRTWKNAKFLIVYEEIISNPKKVVIDLLNFLGESLEGVEEFFENYAEWGDLMLSSYHNQHKDKGPASNNAPIFHSRSFPKEILCEVDRMIQKRYPDLFEKYLKVYAEKELFFPE